MGQIHVPWIKKTGWSCSLTLSPAGPGIPGAPATPLSPYLKQTNKTDEKHLQEFHKDELD